MATDSDSKKGKKTKQKSNKSISVPEDDTEQTEAGNNRRQTCSTTLKTKNSDNDSEEDGDRTVTDENPEEGKNETADGEQNDEQPKLDTSIGKRSKCKEKHCQLRTDKTHGMKPQMRYSKMRKLMIHSIATFVKRLS